MHMVRKDGNVISLSEEKLVLKLFQRQEYPTPYTHEELIEINNLDGTLSLSVEVNNADEDVSTEYILTFFDKKDERFYRESYEYYVDYTTDRARWRVIRDLCYHRLRQIESEIDKRLGGDQSALDSVTWYNGLAEHVLRWKQEALPISGLEGRHFRVGSTTYGVEEPDDRELYQLQVLWMIAVDKFGDCGTSPRTGWIENIPLFVLWCDEITQTYSYDIGSIEYINKQEEKKND